MNCFLLWLYLNCRYAKLLDWLRLGQLPYFLLGNLKATSLWRCNIWKHHFQVASCMFGYHESSKKIKQRRITPIFKHRHKLGVCWKFICMALLVDDPNFLYSIAREASIVILGHILPTSPSVKLIKGPFAFAVKNMSLSTATTVGWPFTGSAFTIRPRQGKVIYLFYPVKG